ncbi:MAG: hypothetical protein AAGC55_17305, partial [Myxococcota bacterium]
PSSPIDSAMGTVSAELKSLLPFLGVVLLLLPIVGLFLSLVVQPLIEILLNYYLLAVFYILMTEASAFVLYATLSSALFLLVLVLAVYIVAMTFFIGTVRKILRSKFHYGQTFGEYKRFWLFGGLCMLLVLVLPLIYVYGLEYIAFILFEPDFDNMGAKDMLLVPMTAFLLFPVLFWAARGLKALGFIKSYPVTLGRL